MRNNNKPKGTSSIITGIFAIGFGIFWTITAISIAPFMAIFGIFFIGITIVSLVNIIKNTISNKEDTYYTNYEYNKEIITQDFKYCTICGSKVESVDQYCKNCGAKLE